MSRGYFAICTPIYVPLANVFVEQAKRPDREGLPATKAYVSYRALLPLG